MQNTLTSCACLRAALLAMSILASLTLQAQTTRNVTIEILGVGAASLLGGDLTDPENDGDDSVGAATSPTWNWAEITSSHESDFQGGENSFNIFDNKVGGGNDKWCCDDPTPDNPVWVAVKFRQPISLTHFTVTSGNDTPTRDPTDWAIQGSNDGQNYRDIFRFVDTVVPWTARNQVVKFTLPFAAPPYSYIRYIAYDTPAPLHQINEIEYFGRAAQEAITVEVRVADGLDDSEEHLTEANAIDITSSDLELGAEGGGADVQAIGIRFRNVDVPAGATITKAYIQFTVDESDTEETSVRIFGELSGNPVEYNTNAGDITSRKKTTAFVDWNNIPVWDDASIGSAGPDQRTPDLSAIVRELVGQVGQSGWTAKNAMSFIIMPNPGGERTAEAFNGEAPAAPLLHIEYGPPGGLPDADKDGIPDEVELVFGFNPNDAADAAQDFDKDGVSNLNEYLAGTDPVDVTKPTVVSIAASSTFEQVTITFSEEVDPATATAIANYSISPSLAVTAATYNRKVVTLTTAKQTPGATAYTVTIKGVKDSSKNEVATDTKALFYSYLLTRNGVLKFSYWTGISGTPIDNLLNDANYPGSPTGVGTVFSLNSRDFFPGDGLENYGAVMEGYITPAESGDYEFFLRSDDASQLYLSTDDKEANLALIAEELDCCDAFMEPSTGDAATTAAPTALVAGRKYFIRVIYKEGGGGDYAQVAWRKTTDKTPAGSLQPISGRFLSAAVDLPAPAEGAFTIQSPGTNARNVKPAGPITIAHRDGKTEWTAANVSLKVDGVTVAPTFTKAGNVATIEYQPSPMFASKSPHTVALGYLDPGGNPATLQWSFEIAEYKGPIKDTVKGYEGIILGSAKLTDDKGGFSGKAGDLAVDFGRGTGQSVLISDASFMNAAAAGDKMTFSLWAKKYDIANNSAFWADSPSSSSGMRGAQAHVPWSNNNVYFDTAGCCDAALQRINAGIDTFASYTGDIAWWTNSWHHFAFVKDTTKKQIWIDGQVFLEGENTSPLPTDFARIWIGAEGGGPNAGTANNFHGLEDDFAIFGSALSEADIKKLAAGASPPSLGAAANLVAYWDFNSLPVEAAKFTKIARNLDGSITLEWTGGGTLEAATSITGPWQAVAGATSPYKFTPTASQMFGRIRR